MSTRTGHVSERVRQAVAQTNGKIFIDDDRMRKLSEVVFDHYGNVVR